MAQTPVSPNQFQPWWENYDTAGQSPEYDISHAYGDLLGRAPEPQGLSGYQPGYQQHGMEGVRRSILASPEYQTRLLGGVPESASQDAGRRAAAGVNAMPGVFSDYTSHQLPASQYQRMGQRAAAQQMMPDAFQAMLGAFEPQPEPEIPPAILQLLGGQAGALVAQTPAPQQQPEEYVSEDEYWRRIAQAQGNAPLR